jgi:hypothetical protein
MIGSFQVDAIAKFQQLNLGIIAWTSDVPSDLMNPYGVMDVGTSWNIVV